MRGILSQFQKFVLTLPKPVKWLFKGLITLLCIYVVSQKIDFLQLQSLLFKMNGFWLLGAVIGFVASKVLSAYRLAAFLRCLGVNLQPLVSWRLYAVGMYYGLLMPGGIGADGYRLYWLRQNYSCSTSQLLAALLIDRISGLVGLGVLGGLLFILHDLAPLLLKVATLTIGLALFAIYYKIMQKYYSTYQSVFFLTNLQGLAVQVAQLASAYALLAALGEYQHWLSYGGVFLLSSIVATVVPLTIGGIGAREYVMAFASTYLPLEVHTAIVLGFLFYVISTFTALAGGFWVYWSGKK